MKGFNKKGILKSIGLFLSLTILLMLLFGCGLKTTSSNATSQDGSVDFQSMNDTTKDIAVEETTTPELQGKKLTMNLYFPDKENDAVMVEKHELTVYEGAVLRAAVEGLLAGPESGNLIKPVPEGTKLLGINLKNDLAIVDFSKEFASNDNVAELVEKISLVNTITEFANVSKVKILIEGNEWVDSNGNPFGEITKIPLDSEGKPIQD
jgi:spore germination protein GerM